MNRALLVGNRSVLGRAVRNSLEKADWRVTTAGRGGADVFLDLAKEYQEPPLLEKHDAVILVAADFGGEQPHDFDRAERVNALGTLHACRWATKVNARHVVIVSSVSTTYNFTDANFGVYAITKRHGEELAQLYCKKASLPLTIVRPTQIYNDDGSCRKHQELFYHIIERAAAGKDIEIFGTHDAKRNFIHLADVSAIIAQIVFNRLGGIFDCPNPSYIKISQLAAIAQSVYGKGGQIRFLKDKVSLADIPQRCGEELFQALDLRTRIGVEDGIWRIKNYQTGLLK